MNYLGEGLLFASVLKTQELLTRTFKLYRAKGKFVDCILEISFHMVMKKFIKINITDSAAKGNIIDLFLLNILNIDSNS